MTRSAHLLLKLRKKHDLTQKELAKKLKMNHHQSVGLIEKGQVLIPTRVMKALAEVSGLPLKQIVKIHMQDKLDVLMSRLNND